MLSLPRRTKLLLLLPWLAHVSSCAAPASVHPPLADLQAVTEPKPEPTDDITISQQAYDLYQAKIEWWGDRVSDAGARLCRWSRDTYKLKVKCPPPIP